MMDIGEYQADIQRNCPSIPMNEAGYLPISIIKNDSIHIVTQ